MKLDTDINYIVSGLERSGTSLLMQILHAGGLPLSYDTVSRPPDDSNPRGYFELEGGKIINKLMDGSFHLPDYKGIFIKITAFGLKFLPPGRYKIIYSLRNLDEIMDSMEKMAKMKDANREETKVTFSKLNEMIKKLILDRKDCEVFLADYNKIMLSPEENIKRIFNFIAAPDADLQAMIDSVDTTLYRNRRA